MQLIRFDYIDDGDLHTNSLIENVDKKLIMDVEFIL